MCIYIKDAETANQPLLPSKRMGSETEDAETSFISNTQVEHN